MRVGDILEWVAGAAFTTAAYLGTHTVWAPVATAGIVLTYEAQCYARVAVPPRPHMPRLHFPWRKAKS